MNRSVNRPRHIPPAGAESVGAFDDASPGERLYVWALRRWLDGPAGQQAVWSHFAATAGAQDGRIALSLFEAHLRAVASQCRRRLNRHLPQCACLGADEATLARVVRLARDGRREDARTCAARLILPAGLNEAVDTAAALGRALASVGDAPPPQMRRAPGAPAVTARPPTFH